MVGKTKPATVAERARFEALHALGCVACRQNGEQRFPAEIHHLLSGGRRRGHLYSVPLCAWHHRGISEHGFTSLDMTIAHGPSLARGSKAFRLHYGSDDELLASVNGMIEQPAEAA